jgi:hypothetical protein
MPVYFIRAGADGPVKIGWSDNVETRRTALQISHYLPLRVIRIIEGSSEATELWLHDHFAQLRLRGEWFEFHPDMEVVEPPVFAPITPPTPTEWRWRAFAADTPPPRDPFIEQCEVRIQRMHSLLRSDRTNEQIAAELGMQSAFAQAERWMSGEAAE